MRRGFADPIKDRVHDHLGDAPKNIEEKDSRVVEGLTFRQWYKMVGAQGKKDYGDDYWIRCLADSVSANEITVITDWRFPNELEALRNQEVVTLHVYRSEIAEAPPSDIFEHSLDDNAAVILMVTSAEEFSRALARFPQYANYIFGGKLIYKYMWRQSR